MKKTVLKSMMTMLVALFSLNTYAYDVEVNGIYYNVVKKAKVAEVTSGDINYVGMINIPASFVYEGATYSVKSIGGSAFYGCSDLTSVIIPNSITEIGSGAFMDCSNLTSITIGSGVIAIGTQAFERCNNLTSVYIYDLTNWCQMSRGSDIEIYAGHPPIDYHLYLNGEEVTDLVIPNGVTSVSTSAFENCRYLTSVSIPESVISIGSAAFSFCRNLTSVNIPESVTSIGAGAFAYCEKLKSVSIPNSITRIEQAMFNHCYNLSSVNIGNKVTSIERVAFSWCTDLKSVTIPNSVTSIGEHAFENCSNLIFVNLSDNIKVIGYGAFQDCNSLTSIIIPNNIKTIEGTIYVGGGAFENCNSLKVITIGSGIESVGNRAFYKCGEITDMYCNAENPPTVGTEVFKDAYIKYATLHVPQNSIYAYQSAEVWSDFGNIVPMEVEEEEPENVILSEGVEMYYNGEERLCNTITYTRTFNNTNWQALYVPFSMSYDDWKDDFEVARINAFYEYDKNEDGVIDKLVLELMPVKEGNGDLRPNYPYLIKAKTTGSKTITLTNATLYRTEQNSIDCSTVETKYTFTGTYQKMNGLKSAGCYFMSGGGLKTAASDDVNLGAFRWYMKIENRGSSLIHPAEIKLRMVDEEDDLTEIEELEDAPSSSDEGWYTLDGVQLMSQPTVKGLYLHKGKKVFIQ